MSWSTNRRNQQQHAFLLQPSRLDPWPTLSHRKPCLFQASAHPSNPGPCTSLPSSWYTAFYPGGWSRLGLQSLSWEQTEHLAYYVKETSFIRSESVSTSLQDAGLGFVSHFISLFCQHSWSKGSWIHLAFSSDTWWSHKVLGGWSWNLWPNGYQRPLENSLLSTSFLLGGQFMFPLEELEPGSPCSFSWIVSWSCPLRRLVQERL